MSRFREIFSKRSPVIGMIHLPPLPDYPDSPGIERVVQHALEDMYVLQHGGVDGVLIENEYDRPHRVEATAETVAAMIEVTSAVVQTSDKVVVGCEILLNDPYASLRVAKESGAQFIRTDYFVDKMTRPEYGEFSIDPEGVIAYRASIEAENVLVLADIQVKYASMVRSRPLSESARLACEKKADAVIITGDLSGDAPALELLRAAAMGVREFDIPVLIGSGVDDANAASLMNGSDGAIVGTSLMRDRAVDATALASLMKSLGRDCG